MGQKEYAEQRMREICAKMGGMDGPERGMQIRMSKKTGIDPGDISRLLDGEGSKRDLNRMFSVWIAEEPKNTQAEFSEFLGYCKRISDVDKRKYEELYLHRFPKEAPQQLPRNKRLYRWYIQHINGLTELRKKGGDIEDEDTQELLKEIRILEEEAKRWEAVFKELAEETTDTDKQGE